MAESDIVKQESTDKSSGLATYLYTGRRQHNIIINKASTYVPSHMIDSLI